VGTGVDFMNLFLDKFSDNVKPIITHYKNMQVKN
jgi:hypothetical protein